MGFPTKFFIPILFLLSSTFSTQSTSQTLGFRCTSTTTCSSLIDYKLPNTNTVSSVANLFQIKNLRTLLAANNLPINTPQNQTLPASQILKIPFPCSCRNGTGISNRRPSYTVSPDDGLYHIAAEVFSGLVTYQQIEYVNNIADANTIEIGQKLWIPLPCSCDEVGGETVVHYGHLVAAGNTVGVIAKQFNRTESTLLSLNGLDSSKDLLADSIIDVPLKVCTSMVRNNSLDYPLLVTTGTYTFTANDCVRCQCDAANNWILDCQPSGIKLPKGQTCPSMQCVGTPFDLGNTTSDSNCIISRCAYAGYRNDTILTTLSQEPTCPDGNGNGTSGNNNYDRGSHISWRIKVALGVGSALIAIVLVSIIYCIMKSSQSNLFKHQTEDDKSIEAFVIQYGSLSTKRYTYDDIKKMTNSFKVKIGQGGFGSVFKGKLSDGRLVAVKVLNSSKASGQEFINEVASIGRTSHVNIVSLLGFCFDYQNRALVYEFMPNGSLEKFKCYHDTQSTSEHIGVDKLYEISLGIARGLDYLHHGCNTRILHLDIKPHNILLDEDFCPKIADFGLAKLYSRKDSIVSMLEARGTIGYIAPEVFYRNFGGVSHKSDVYSYGMLILEIVGGRKINVEVGSADTSGIKYFPNWIYSRLNKDEFLFDGVTSSTENEYVRKMSIVGLWCIQTNPKQRPSINEVIEMLVGSMEALEIPPKPFFSSPPRSPATTFNTLQEERDEDSISQS